MTCIPIPPQHGEKTPDYQVWLDQLQVIAEVKEIVPADFEFALEASADDPDSPFLPSTAANRIRNKFDDAKRQLRRLSKSRHPAVFVLFDSTGGLSGLDNEDFMNAMYGDEIVVINGARWNHLFGRRRKLGVAHNTFVSAFGHMAVSTNGEPHLRLYHSDFADIPLSPISASRLASRQFIRPPSPSAVYRGWTEVKLDEHDED